MKKQTKQTKKWKKIKNFTLLGIASSIIVGTLGIILNNKKTKTNVKTPENNYQSLISKIKDKDLIINKDVDTSTDAKIFLAIKNQLKKENPLLTDQDLAKINDNITSLVPGVKTKVVLTILVDNQSDNIDIKVTRPLNDFESINDVKNALKNLVSKEIRVSATSGTITDHKEAIKNKLNKLISFSKINLRETNIFVKNQNTELTLSGTPFTILISKEGINQEIGSEFIVKRSKNVQEINNDKVVAIKNKIKDKDLIINKDVDTSTDAKILLAIKNQLKVENPLLNDEDLSKINDNITSLAPGVKTNVVLTILIDNQSDTINIEVTRPLNDVEAVNDVKNALKNLVSKEIQINAVYKTITNNKQIMKNALNKLISSSKIDLKGTIISIKDENTKLTFDGVPFTILISKEDITEEIISEFIVKLIKKNVEKNKEKIALIKSKIKVKTFNIDKDVDTSDDFKTLLAIKNQLKIENPSLTDEDLLKIDDNIMLLVPNKKTSVALIISVGSEKDIVKISTERDYSDLESVDKTKYALEKNAPKEITVSATSGTISDHKNLIAKTLKKNYWFKVILGSFKLPNIAIKEEDTELTLEGVPFTILVSKGSITKEIVSMYIVKRSKNTEEKNTDKVATIKNKIVDKNLIIGKNVNTSNDAALLQAIKNQLNIENPSLTNEDLSKITDNIDSLEPEKRTLVILTISAGAKSDTTEIWITRPLSDTESIDLVKKELESLVSKEITISATSGTISDHKAAIFNALNSLIQSSKIDLKGTIISIKNENSELTLNGVPFTILISKGSITKKMVSTYKVKRSKNTQEINSYKVTTIKNKIVNKDLVIDKNVDTSSDEKILLAIKNQLKIENSLFSDEELSKITDNITSLVPGVKTNVTLTILIGAKSDTIKIQVTRPLSDFESVVVVKKELESLASKEITIGTTSGTITDNKQAIIEAFNLLIDSLNLDLKGTNILIKDEDTKITLSGIPFTIQITKGLINQEVASIFRVKKILNHQQIVSKIKSKIKNKVLIIPKNVDTSNDQKTLLAIKNQLKVENPSLKDKQLEKITDNIIYLKPEKKILVTLKIKSKNVSELVKVFVTKKRNMKLRTKNSASTWSSNIKDGFGGVIFQDSYGNIWAMGFQKKLQVLGVNSQRWENSTKSGLTKGSNIEYGTYGIIFEDSSGNLWAMGHKTDDNPETKEEKLQEAKLQVLRVNSSKNGYVNTGWDSNNLPSTTGLLKGSNIKNAEFGFIFEDSSGNLWAMGKETKLQLLKKQKDGSFADLWTDDNNENGEPLLKGSNIVDGKRGFIFEDSSGNIWAMGKGTKLQVLSKKEDGTFEDRWNSNGKLLNGSNIIDGELGFMFEDSFGNLWAVVRNSRLQVLKKQKDGSFANSWTDDNNESLLKGSNIRESEGIFMFQDSSKNLWVMTKNSKLQVLKVNENGDGYVDSWTNNNGLNNDKNVEKLLKGSNINNGHYGVIFEDSSGNLWAMGKGTKLQVLVKNKDGSFADSWTDDNSENGEPLLKGSRINDGHSGFIFEDSSGNIWAAGKKSPLQVFDKTQQKWIIKN